MKKSQSQPKMMQPVHIISNHGYQQTVIHKSPQSTPNSVVLTPKSVASKVSVGNDKSSIFMSLLKAPPRKSSTISEYNNHKKISMEIKPKTQQHKTATNVVINELDVNGVYEWAINHPFIGIKKIAQQLRQHEIDGKKLQKLDEITLHIFGVPSKYISKTYKIIKSL